MKTSDITRVIITIIILYFVWTNSHWSVALSLTLMFIQSEMVSLIINNKLNQYR